MLNMSTLQSVRWSHVSTLWLYKSQAGNVCKISTLWRFHFHVADKLNPSYTAIIWFDYGSTLRMCYIHYLGSTVLQVPNRNRCVCPSVHLFIHEILVPAVPTIFELVSQICCVHYPWVLAVTTLVCFLNPIIVDLDAVTMTLQFLWHLHEFGVTLPARGRCAVAYFQDPMTDFEAMTLV